MQSASRLAWNETYCLYDIDTEICYIHILSFKLFNHNNMVLIIIEVSTPIDRANKTDSEFKCTYFMHYTDNK